MTIWRRLRRLFWCSHEHTRKERRGKVLTLVCDQCDSAFPVSVADRAKAKRLTKRLQASKAVTPRVVPMRRAQQ